MNNNLMNRNKIDIVLGGTVIVLIMLGQLMVFSSSSMVARQNHGSLWYFFEKQLVWSTLSIILLVVFSKIDYKILQKNKLPHILIILSIILLTGLLFFGITRNGATRWYPLGGSSFQPTEFVKIAVIIFLAHKLSERGLEKQDFKSALLPIYLLLGIIFSLILIQPDLSSTLMLILVSGMMMFVSRIRQRYLGYTVLGIVPFAIIFWQRGGYQVRRITEWMESVLEPLKANDQVLQSIVGIGRGGIWGNGLGESKQKLFFLPDSYTDFIFSIIGEEFGFIGASLILVLFLVVLIRGLRISKLVNDDFGKFLAFGITMIVVLYAFMNVAVVSNMVPATGLPLPFISYGGSHVVFMGMSVGLLLNISRSIKGAQTDGYANQRSKLQSAIIEVG